MTSVSQPGVEHGGQHMASTGARAYMGSGRLGGFAPEAESDVVFVTCACRLHEGLVLDAIWHVNHIIP